MVRKAKQFDVAFLGHVPGGQGGLAVGLQACGEGDAIFVIGFQSASDGKTIALEPEGLAALKRLIEQAEAARQTYLETGELPAER